jgi:hypothetical protein
MFSLPASFDVTRRDRTEEERGNAWQGRPLGGIISLFYSPRRYTVVGESEFRAGLRLEQRRQERSGRPFVLVRISAPELFSSGATRRLVRSVSMTSRQTDTIGWIETGKVLGVLCTELGEHGEVSAGGIILGRMRRATRKALHAHQSSLELSLELYSRPQLSSGQARALRGQLVS